ncbi:MULTISPECIES: beta-propeller fold lactonase family protein [unclassified Streptomyces]|uniref:YncE family protein n=1 Tax=unclassified Streptomyces TaxID=2593676 RepID=UPI000DB97BE1|nr:MULTISPECIES: beta-propeller fold lactonase family protein [unclassified Streptomyces]MYT68295.1 beta-propeller fold lactonase family protein [Streptomyces sp. SID8367]RAJ76930.1 YVTN family beta-propeller protein [Streptomyces sp. PsTaAH-137]
MRNVQFFSTDTDDGVVSVVSKTGPGEHRRVAQIPVGNAPRGGVKFTRGGRGFVCNTSQNTLSEIDAVSLREVRRIEVGHGPRGMAIVPGERYLLVSNSGSNTVSVVDLELNVEVRQIETGRDPRHMGISADGRLAYVCVWGEGYISKLDISPLIAGAPEQVAEVSQIVVDREAHPYSLAVHPDGRKVFVANTQADYLTVIDVASEVCSHVSVGSSGGRAVAFTDDGRFALVTVENLSSIIVVDVNTLQVARTIPVGSGPRGLVVDSDQTVYVTNFSRANLTMEGHPHFGPNSLTMVDLNSAPLDREEGAFTYEEVVVGYGPCSVTMFDLDTLTPEERERRLDRADSPA